MIKLVNLFSILIFCSITFAITPSSLAKVRIEVNTPEKIVVRTGDYHFSYERGDCHVKLFKRGSKNGFLATNFVSGQDLRLLQDGEVHSIQCIESKESIQAILSGDLSAAAFQVTVIFNKRLPGWIHYQVDLEINQPVFMANTEPEWEFFDSNAQETDSPIQDLFSTYPYLAQTSVYAPFAYFYEPDIIQSKIFYYANYTSMNDYYNYLAIEPKDAVSKQSSNRFGYTPPSSKEFQIPAGIRLRVVDSFIGLEPGKLGTDLDYCRYFVEGFCVVYNEIEKPQTDFADWRDTALKTLESLEDESCITDHWEHRILRAYVNIAETHTDLETNLFVLTPLEQFNAVFGEGESLKRMIEKATGMFYVEGVTDDYNTIFDNVPSSKDPSHITTHPASTWYYTFNMLQMAKIARYGNPEIREMFLGSLPYMIRFSRSVDYEFPIFADYLTLEVKDPRLEGDMAGCYAYTMLIAYELTGADEYLEEAKKSIERLVGKGFKVGYEMHITASGIAACGWLYEITRDKRYLDIAYIPLANLLRDTWLWESDCGYAYGYRTFNNIAAQRGCPVVGPVEQTEAWGFLREFYLKTETALPKALRRMIPEYMKQTMASAYHSFPETLPAEAMHPGPPYAPGNPDLWIGLEGIRPGLLKSGSIGQAVYMSGGPFRYAGYSYHRPVIQRSQDPHEKYLEGVFVFSEYPLTECKWDTKRKTLEFSTAGDKEYPCRVRVYFDPQQNDLSGYILKSGRKRLIGTKGKDSFLNYLEFSGIGGTRYRMSRSKWRKDRPVPTPQTKDAKQDIRIHYFPHRKAFIAPGKSYPYTLVLKNLSSLDSSVAISTSLPEHWTVSYPAGKELFIPPSTEKEFPVIVSCPTVINSSSEIIRICAIINGQNRPVVNQVFSILSPTVTAGEDLSDLAEWEISEGTSYSQLTREITVNLDQAGFLFIDTQGLTGGYTLFASDGYTDQIRIISDTGHFGQYTCDLKKMTGWQGTHRFKFILYNWGATAPPVLNAFELRDSRSDRK